ncbi:hypothetical protein HX021_15765 [Sphingobacterium sp. N143]|uniref:hypothetical protein n=1 Tax=Sphingobacterium sp. N143 TaxID=2746727 RepID=UPI002574D120|nr:hypothetical protein [Sphingobacterium sp. N143]MDM1295747.1 hypothetical protein [Sphingobacterium sp. N143]
MNRYVVFALAAFSLLVQACNNPTSTKKTTTIDSLVPEDSLALSVKDTATRPLSLQADSARGQLLLIRSYRMWEKEDPTAVLNKDWLDLYEEDGKFYLAKVDYEIKDSYDECAQVPSKSVESKRNSLLFLNIKGLQTGAVEHVEISHSEIWPKESVNYTFKNQQITLKASGNIKSTEVQTDGKGHEKIFHEVANYRLSYVLGATNKAYEIFHIDQYDNVFMATRFVGDIDRDGQLDFIFSNPSHYEEESILLMLSNHGVPLVFEADVQFDC